MIHGCLIAWLIAAVPASVRAEALALALAGGEGDPDPAGIAFFEQKIRPVLVKECYACHSAGAKKVRGNLWLDTRAGVLAGGDTGPAVVPGKPEESTLMEALRHEGLAMPPKNKLPDAVIADFERWINMGAPDPRAGQAAPARVEIDLAGGRRFWSYQLPRHHPSPAVADADTGWPRTEIDGFVLAALEARGLRPLGDADRATLARRLAYDLAGLPPAPEEIDAFVNDQAPDAYERLVDRLLASPRFGERWGRHWLDVVRFAESLTLRGFIFKEAWRYRDYVIAAFNRDMPFDRFVAEQIAGDLLDAPGLGKSKSLAERRGQRIATTFLVLGNNNLEEQDKPQLRMDVVDEQIDTIGKAFLAQTIACARCHDHKFDPIPTRDYYALAGILRNVKALEHANVSKWLELPLPAEPAEEAVYRQHETAVAALEAQIKQIRKAAGTAPSQGVIAANTLPGIVVDDTQARKVGVWSESRVVTPYIGSGYSHDDNSGKGEKTLTFQPEIPAAGVYEVRLAYTPGTNRAPAVPVTVFSADGEDIVTVDMKTDPPIDGRFVSLGRHRFERNGQGYVMISNADTKGTVVGDAVQFLPADAADRADAAAAQAQAQAQTTGRSATAPPAGMLKKMEAELKRLKASGPKRDLVMSVTEEGEIGDTQVHIRGSVHTLGEPAPRGFLQVATAGAVPTFSRTESGRRELAAWLASKDNPLTARVIVNRVWHWLFGAGLVRTMDNFGTTGELPSHPELLDELAVQFMADGWSIKTLVRRIVLSHVYQLATAPTGTSPDETGRERRARAADPENRLLWKMNRRRLDAECIRDTILCLSGQLRQEMGGPSFPAALASDYGFQQTGTRRSVYEPVFRNELPELFEAFDFADPSMVVGRRSVSTVAPQALLLMNHPFIMEQARYAARRLLAEPEVASSQDDGDGENARITRAYRLVLGRPPREGERRIALKFLAQARGGPGSALNSEGAWAGLFQALFATIDFRYLD
jgi:hypothetical protein